jgi:hypothetical protein
MPGKPAPTATFTLSVSAASDLIIEQVRQAFSARSCMAALHSGFFT